MPIEVRHHFNDFHRVDLLFIAGIFHYSIPILSQPVKDKRQLKSIFAVGYAFTTFVYVTLGVILGMYFGKTQSVSERVVNDTRRSI